MNLFILLFHSFFTEAYPPAPETISPIAYRNQTILLQWSRVIDPDRLKDLGNFPLTFTVSCIDHFGTGHCAERKETNRTGHTSGKVYYIPNALPYTRYLFQVCAHTNVSLANQAEVGNCRQIGVMTQVGCKILS